MATCTMYPYVSFILCVLIASNCWAECDQEAKFAELNKKLDILIEQLVQPSQPIQPVQPTGNTSDTSSPVQGSGDDDDDDDVPIAETGVDIVEFRRESLGNDDIQFIIKYRSSVDFLIRWYDFNKLVNAPVKQEKLSRTDDVQEARYASQSTNSTYDNVFVSIYPEEKNAFAGFRLSRFDNADTLATNIVLPVFGSAPAGDFVYEEGKNITIKLRVPFDSNFNFQLGQIDKEKEILDFNTWVPDAYDILETKKISDSEVLTVRINTVKYNSSGYVLIRVKKEESSETDLVGEIWISILNVIRPSSQAGRLPEGFLGFQGNHNFPSTENWCSIYKTCDIECMAVGEDITSLSIYRIEPEGSRTRINGLTSDVEDGHEFTVYVRTIAGVLPQESIGTVQYQCVVDNAHGMTKTQIFTYTYFIPLKIIKDQSGVYILNENDNSTIRQLAVVCTITGYPQPNITFTIQQMNSYESDVEPAEIVDNGNNEFTATEYVTFDISDPSGDNGEFNGKLDWASCTAVAGTYSIAYGYDSYYMNSIPDDIGK